MVEALIEEGVSDVVAANLEMMQASADNLDSMKERKFTDSEGRKITVKELPLIPVYHLQYDAKGKLIDYHVDHWRYDPTSNLKKLQRRYAENAKPVWVLRKPDIEKPAEDIACRHPRCPRYFRTVEEREMHVQAQHREFYAFENQRETRQAAEEQNRLLRLQIETLSRLLEERGDTGPRKTRPS